MIREGNDHSSIIVSEISPESISDVKKCIQEMSRKAFENADRDQIYYAATLTDMFRLGIWEDDESRKLITQPLSIKLLELRVFNKDVELKAWRSDIGSQFQVRIIDDRPEPNTIMNNDSDAKRNKDFFEEVQLLDIDRNRSGSSNNIKATGGGCYSLPEHIFKMKNPGLLVRHYIDRYEQTGNAFVRDWRCVGFEDVSEEISTKER